MSNCSARLLKQNNTPNTPGNALSGIAQMRKSSDQVSSNAANIEEVDYPDKTNQDTPTGSMSHSPELSKEPQKVANFEAGPFSYNYNASMLSGTYTYPFTILTPSPLLENNQVHTSAWGARTYQILWLRACI